MQWISVKDRLPEKHGLFLTYCNDPQFFDLSYFYPRDGKYSPCWKNHHMSIDIDEPTHWMPLPTPTKGDDKD
jgi:hypothetical protein